MYNVPTAQSFFYKKSYSPSNKLLLKEFLQNKATVRLQIVQIVRPSAKLNLDSTLSTMLCNLHFVFNNYNVTNSFVHVHVHNVVYNVQFCIHGGYMYIVVHVQFVQLYRRSAILRQCKIQIAQCIIEIVKRFLIQCTI